MRKILYFDVETTGLDASVNEIVQLGMIIEVDGKEVDRGEFFLKPEDPDNITEGSLEVTGKTKEELMAYPDRVEGFVKIRDMFAAHCDKYDRNDKYYPAGYNVGFDLDFLAEFFKGMGDNYLGSYLNWRQVDPLRIMQFLDAKGEVDLPDYKLATVCELFDIKIDAHDAMSDIEATQKLVHILFDKIKVG